MMLLQLGIYFLFGPCCAPLVIAVVWPALWSAHTVLLVHLYPTSSLTRHQNTSFHVLPLEGFWWAPGWRHFDGFHWSEASFECLHCSDVCCFKYELTTINYMVKKKEKKMYLRWQKFYLHSPLHSCAARRHISCVSMISQNESRISKISTKYNCDWQVFVLSGVKPISCNSGQISQS